MSDEKTEEPTDKRLRDSRDEGEVAHSTDLVGAVVLCASFGMLFVLRTPLADWLQAIPRDALAFLATNRSPESLNAALHVLAIDGIRLLTPFALMAALAAILASLPQVGLTISFHPITPNLEAISPDKGFKRIFSVKSLVEIGLCLLKSVVLSATLYLAIKMLMPLVANSVAQPLGVILSVSWTALLRVVGCATLAFLMIGLADFQFQRWNFLREHRMTKDEVKREHKETEGDPHIKQKRKRIAKEIAFGPSSTKAVKRASVLVVNPTHLAVAVRYDPTEHPLPVVIAKGADQAALDLRQVAHAWGVPIVGNPPVARALFQIELNRPIPEPSFEAVAAILRWVEEIGARNRVEPQLPGAAS